MAPKKPRNKAPRAGTLRAQMLDVLRKTGPLRFYILAEMVKRPSTNIYPDMLAMQRKGLVQKSDEIPPRWSVA